MARNSYPEETRKKILDMARQLFYEKGYDNTTIQDIIDGLGGLTKGVIYHHFESKQAILESVLADFGGGDDTAHWSENWQGATGLEKIKSQIKKSLQNYERFEIFYSAEVLLRSPRMIGEVYLATLSTDASYLQTYIDEGIRDGSIVTDFPRELAELSSLVINMWLGLGIVRQSKDSLNRRLLFLKCAFHAINVPIIDDETVETTLRLHDHMQRRKQRLLSQHQEQTG